MTVEMIVVLAIIALVMLRFAPPILEGLAPFVAAILNTVLDFTCWCVGRFSRVARLCLVIMVTVPILGLNVYLFGITSDLPDLEPLINYRPKQIGYFYDGKGTVVIKMADHYREPIEYSEMPVVVRQAIIAAEDGRFYTRLHSGVDPLAWPRVIYKNLTGAKLQGGSTISQQTTKGILMKRQMELERTDTLAVDNLFTREIAKRKGVLWTNRHVRKVMELKFSPYVERGLTDHFESTEVVIDPLDRIVDGRRNRARRKAKDHILGVYANEIYLGNGVYGFPYGARFYCGKSIHELEAHEAALLASFIPFPGPYASLRGTEDDLRKKRGRRNKVLKRMHRRGFLTQSAMVSAMLEPVVLKKHTGGSKTSAPAAVNLALDEVKALGIAHEQITSGFAHPYMTIDPDIQDAVNRGVQAGMENFNNRWPGVEMPQMAVVILRNHDAAILGMYGGHLDNDVHNYSSYNRATMSVRQPGSTFKGIDALAAVQRGVTPSSVFDDRPYCINMGRGRKIHCVSNYDGSFRGMMNVREIIAQSRNVPTLRMIDSLKDDRRKGHRGIDEVIATARMLGLTTEMHRYSVSALGADGVIPLEFANAYRAIASGISAKPYIVSQITDERGNILAEHAVLTEPLPVSPRDLRTVQELLRGTIRLPGGTGRSLKNFHVPCAGKTGTSNEHRDAWFVCFTYGSKGITVLAWVGYDDFLRELPHEGRPKATGGSAALPIVRAVLDGVYGENKPLGEPPHFPRELEASIDNYVYWNYTFPKMFQ